MKLELIINYMFLLVTILAIYISVRNFVSEDNENNKFKQFIEKHATKIVLLILFIFTLTKMYRLAELPYEHLDEQFLMYQVKSFVTIGADMYGAKFPVYSRAWGWGMSMGYIYIATAFCKLFGVSYFTVRFPMMIIGTISGWFVYLIGKNKNKLYGIMATLIYCCMPFNWFGQRWALDRTLFPLIFIIGVYFAIEYFKKQKVSNLYIAFIFFGLSLYGYANAYIIVPAFLIFCLYYGIKNKRIKPKDTIGPVILLAIIALPLILFVLKSVFGFIDIDKFLFFTISDAHTDRGSEFGLYLDQVIDVFKTLLGTNGCSNISIVSSGLYFLFMMPFTLFGIISYFRKNAKKEVDVIDSIFLFLLIIALIYGIIILDSDAGKLNILMVTFPFVITEGINYVFKNRSKMWVLTIAMTIICSTVSIYGYLANDGYLRQIEAEINPVGIEVTLNEIQHNEELKDKNIYLVCFGQYGIPAMLNSLDLTAEEMSSLKYVDYEHPYYGQMEVFNKVKNFELIKVSGDSSTYLERFDNTEFELDSNGVYVMPVVHYTMNDIYKAVESKISQVSKLQYSSELERYNIYY